jgi:hypothetical protein
MKRIFQHELNGNEIALYNKAISIIKENNKNLIDRLDNLIIDYKEHNEFETRFYLDNEKDINKKIDYLKKLREKLLKMNDCDKVLVKVASPFHPMCWAYHLSKLFPKNEKIKNYIMYRILCTILYQSSNYDGTLYI